MERTITVTGRGAIHVVPDVTRLEVRIDSHFKTYQDAYDQAKDMEFGMAVYTGQTPNGTFTVEDIYEPYVDYGYTNYYNYLYSENSALDLSFVEMNVTGALNADGTYTFGGDVVASNGIKYAFSNVVATEFQDEEGGDVAAAPAKKAVSKVAIKKAIRDLKVKKLAVRK